jgi:hypothetical protein
MTEQTTILPPSTESEWIDQLDERQKKQIAFCELYASDFHHGADGHNSMMLIAKMASLLNETERSYHAVQQIAEILAK